MRLGPAIHKMSITTAGQKLIPTLPAYVFSGYTCAVAAVIILYDYATTISQEARVMWGSHTTAAVILFAINRILSVFYAVGLIVSQLHWSGYPSVFGAFVCYSISQFLLLFVWAVFSALRVYAIGKRAWRAAVIVFLISLLPFVLNAYVTSTDNFVNLDLLWVSYSAIPPRQFTILAIAVRVSAIVSDAYVLVYTWTGVYSLGGTNQMRGARKTPLITLLLCDGTVYFASLLLINLALLIIYSQSSSNDLGLSPIVTALSSVIISRFILNLRTVDAERERLPSVLAYTIPRFHHQQGAATGFIGNFGAGLDGSFGFGARDGDCGATKDTDGSGCAEHDESSAMAGEGCRPMEIQEVSRV